ncbi:MAG: hypothetical protein JWM41_2916 [Gemmatimonadetes bacterium]|nr:hypothetical protein [Gemmatimonadota bacterium]
MKKKSHPRPLLYDWAQGSRIEASAQAVGERIETIRTVNAGSVTPELLVDDAQDEHSPLHPCFEWDDTAAAVKYRLDQARLVLRSITIAVAEDRRVPVRAFVAVVREDGEKGRAYTSVGVAMSSPAMREQLLGSALREIQSWRSRYSRLQELAAVFAAVDQLDIEVPGDAET